LNLAQSEYLRSANYLPVDLQELITSQLLESKLHSRPELSLDDDAAESFRQAFTERLAQAGFDGDYKLTQEGATLELLIETFAG
jgi:hypothetical protein